VSKRNTKMMVIGHYERERWN